jgi:small subunit ribosomal protein S18
LERRNSDRNSQDKGGLERRKRRRKPCFFCVNKVPIDFKDLSMMKRFMTDRGKIAPRRMSGACAKHQRGIAVAIKHTRQLGLLPYTVD